MARVPRQVFPGVPHHVVQRGSRRAPVFFGPEDYRRYLRLLRRYCRKHAVEAWCYCLMPNHVHLILCPATQDALGKALGEAHRRYAWEVNRRHDWVGHLWQERFHSFAMDEVHLLAAVRYVLLNPVRAGLCSIAAAWPHSSTRAHLGVVEDALVDVRPLEHRIESWSQYLRPGPADLDELVRNHSRSGQPLGSEGFIARCKAIAASRRSADAPSE